MGRWGPEYSVPISLARRRATVRCFRLRAQCHGKGQKACRVCLPRQSGIQPTRYDTGRQVRQIRERKIEARRGAHTIDECATLRVSLAGLIARLARSHGHACPTCGIRGGIDSRCRPDAAVSGDIRACVGLELEGRGVGARRNGRRNHHGRYGKPPHQGVRDHGISTLPVWLDSPKRSRRSPTITRN
jgi:hypothetical protein